MNDDSRKSGIERLVPQIIIKKSKSKGNNLGKNSPRDEHKGRSGSKVKINVSRPDSATSMSAKSGNSQISARSS